MRMQLIAGLVILVAGCTPVPDSAPPEATPPTEGGLETRAPDTCNVARFADLINQPAAAASIVPEPKRVIGPADIVTNEYIPNRVNIGINGAGTIIELGCG